MIGQKNITNIFVSDNGTVPAQGITPDELANGQLGVFVNEEAVDPSTYIGGDTDFKIAMRGIDGVLMSSQVINRAEFLSGVFENGVNPKPQITYIGYNTHGGSIEARNNTAYALELSLSNDSKTFGNAAPILYYAYTSSDTATAIEIADGFVTNINRNIAGTPEKPVLAYAMTSDPGTASTIAGNVKFTKNSKFIATDNTTDAQVGDYIAYSNVANGVHRVVKVTAEGITLSNAYLGQTITVPASLLIIVPAANAAAASAGIALKSNTEVGHFNPGVDKYTVPTFLVSMSPAFGNTPKDMYQGASNGTGTYMSIANIEWFLFGNTSESWRAGEYPKGKKLNAQRGSSYDIISIEYKDKSATTIDRNVESFATLMVAGSKDTLMNYIRLVLSI